MRSTPVPNETLRTVIDSRGPEPLMPITIALEDLDALALLLLGLAALGAARLLLDRGLLDAHVDLHRVARLDLRKALLELSRPRFSGWDSSSSS